MELTSLHKHIALNKMANNTTEVVFAGQPCLTISSLDHSEGTSHHWTILPVFAKLTYGANVISDIPFDTESSETLEHAVASGLQKLWELGAFRTMVDLPEDSYAATLEEGLDSALASVTEDYKKIALTLSNSLFEASNILNKILLGTLSIDLSEEIISELKQKLQEKAELTLDEQKVIFGSLASKQTHFISEETGLFLGSTIDYQKFVEPVQENIEEVHENAVEAKEEIKNNNLSFIEWKASKANLTEGINDDDYYQVHKSSKKITKHLGKRQVGFEHKDSPEKSPALAEYCDKEHTCMTGMRAKLRGYTNEDRESEFNANSQLSGSSTSTKKKIKLKTPGGSVISSHDSESEAIRAYKALKDSKGVKFVHESEEGAEVDVTDWFLAEVKSADDKYAEWEENVRKAHPEKELKFKGRVEKGVHTTSAEVSGKDRSFGVWDHDKNTGHIFEAEGEEIIGEEVVEEVELQEEVQTTILKPVTYVSKYASGVKAQ